MASTIRKLTEDVINRIAAGEIIHRPANALKEMLENSLDAGSTQIVVTAKDGGLKKEDLGIVCERFTTSKIAKFEDLESLDTYGFRGEALASISHVAHVTITTMTADAPCAFRACYADGKLVPEKPGQSADPKPTAGVKGTTISVEDLFFNIVTRRKAFKSPSEEYQRIVTVVTNYAVHNSGKSFICKKFGEALADVNTAVGSTKKDNIGKLYGAPIARELIEIEHNDDEKYHFQLEALVTKPNYSSPKKQFIFFINNRLVESGELKRAIDSVYTKYLPKGSQPFVYLSLKVRPSNIDVNIHPTKQEVRILNQAEIFDKIQNLLDGQLKNVNTSRTFTLQTPISDLVVSKPKRTEPSQPASNNASQPDYRVVRTDPKAQPITAFLKKPTTAAGDAEQDLNKLKRTGTVALASPKPDAQPKKQRSDVQLTSIQNLIAEVEKAVHPGLKNIFENFAFVGCVDHERALFQHETKLYLVDTGRVSQEFFYQQFLFKFGNFEPISLAQPVSLTELLMLSLECEASGWTEADGDKETIAKSCAEILIRRRDMLLEYIAFDLTESGQVSAFPQLLPNYIPEVDFLPLLFLRLATEVEWEAEQGCFQTLGRELSTFTMVQPTPYENEDNIKWTIEHVLYPAFKSYEFFPPKEWSNDGTIVNIAQLETLYKVFERC